MDPDANLQRQLTLIHRLTPLADLDPEQLTPSNIDDMSNICNELVDLIPALHQWICRGGFLPVPWQSHNCGRTDDVIGK